MTPRAILAIITVLFVGVLGYGYITISHQSTAPAYTDTQSTSQNEINTASSTDSSQTNNTESTQSSGYTMAQVATHKDASSCWTTIGGKVYDLTEWINQHPGGPGPILSLCGTDGTKAFTAQHNGQARPAAELKTLYIGDLIQ